MPRVDEPQPAVVGLDDRVDDRRQVVRAQGAVVDVHPLRERGRRVALERVRPRDAAQLAHPGRRRDAAARDVAHDEADAPARERDDVVPVAADLDPVPAGAEVRGEGDAGQLGQRLGEEVVLEGRGDVLLALEQERPADDERRALGRVADERGALAGRRRAVGLRDGDRPEELAARAQRDGQRAVVELDRAAPVGERVAQPAAGGLGRPALGVCDDGAAGVDHAHGRAAGVEDLVQPAAQLLDDIVEHHRVEAVGDRRHPREAPGERLGLVSRGALGGRPLERGVGRAPGAQVLDLDEQGARVAVRVAHRRRDHPDRDLGRAGQEAQLGRVGLTARHHLRAQRDQGRAVGRMERRGEGAARAEVVAEQRGERGVDADDEPVGVDEHGARRRGLPRPAQELVGALAAAAVALELGEHRDLRPQHDRVERLEDVVHRARLVAAEHLRDVGAHGGQEDDRRPRAALAPADVLGRLVAVHAGHPDVEQHDREVLGEQRAQRLLARPGGDETDLERLEDGRQREQVLGPVVDEQDARALHGIPRGAGCGYHRSHTRMSDSSWSMSTGLVM